MQSFDNRFIRDTVFGRYSETFQPNFGGTPGSIQFRTKMLTTNQNSSSSFPYSWYVNTTEIIGAPQSRLGIGVPLDLRDLVVNKANRFPNGTGVRLEMTSSCRVTWEEPVPANFPNSPVLSPGLTAFWQVGPLETIGGGNPQFYVNDGSVDVLRTTGPLSLTDALNAGATARIFSANCEVQYRGVLNLRAFEASQSYVAGVACHVPVGTAFDVRITDWSGSILCRRLDSIERIVTDMVW